MLVWSLALITFFGFFHCIFLMTFLTIISIVLFLVYDLGLANSKEWNFLFCHVSIKSSIWGVECWGCDKS